MSLRLVALLACASALTAPAAASAAERVDLIVQRDSGLSAAERTAVRAEAGVEHERALLLADTELVSVPAARADRALAALNADPDVVHASRDVTLHATATSCPVWPGPSQADCPSDPLLTSQYALDNAGQTLLLGPNDSDPGTADADMDIFEAWGRGATGTGVTVAVIDTGADLTHPDLDGRLATNPGETGAGRETNGIDDDRNGYVDDARGWDWVGDDALPADEDGHGTHVLGTVVAANGNGIGVSGVAPDAQALPLRVLDDQGDGLYSDILDAMVYAGRLGIGVVNLSLGGEGDAYPAEEVARRYPRTLYVAAAGNDTQNLEVAESTPCKADAPNVVCVGATDNDDRLADFSNYGTTAVDLYAPGDYIAGPKLGGGYVLMSGTSMATPNVSGVAALVRQLAPTGTGSALAGALRAAVDRKPSLPSVTGGRINGAAAVVLVAVDTDRDGIRDVADNCPTVANASQADGNGDGVGDACQPQPIAPVVSTPPAPVPIATPTPAPRPATPKAARVTVRSLAVKVTRRRARVTLRTSAAVAKAQVQVQRRVCRRGTCKWTTVARMSRSLKNGSMVYTPGKRLGKGSYRAYVTLGGGSTRSAAFTVR